MKVSGTGSASSSSSTKRSAKTEGKSGAFSRALADSVGETQGAQTIDSPTPLGGVNALLAVQAVEGVSDRESRRRMARRGEEILDQLEDLRRDLLVGEVSRERLEQLGEQVRSQREEVGDPALALLLDEIDLRAQVELAKLTRDR